MAFRIGDATILSMLSPLFSAVDSGYLRFYNGTMPATPDDAMVGETLLMEIALPNPAFQTPANQGTYYRIHIQPGLSGTGLAAAGVGTQCNFVRFYASNGTSCIWQDNDVDQVTGRIYMSDELIAEGQVHNIANWWYDFDKEVAN